MAARNGKISPVHLLGDFLFYVALFLFAVIWRRDSTCIVGSVIAVPAFALWFLAKLQLGSSFTPKAEARTLVTQGLYSRIRHPIYLFGTLALLGIAICLHSAYFYAYLGLTIAAQLWRIQREERVLREKFGEAYVAYRRHTWF
ncbi:MAG TPA: isoprenylcysteine carboxylmethyltransferase family protein [Candidatus Solibacter sp.]|nr:isoprenylcysteine carboxylmethyltransferase family protein [Candidatus Solibacter sp.]